MRAPEDSRFAGFDRRLNIMLVLSSSRWLNLGIKFALSSLIIHAGSSGDRSTNPVVLLIVVYFQRERSPHLISPAPTNLLRRWRDPYSYTLFSNCCFDKVGKISGAFQ